jgi:hypothetical protein
VDPHYGCCGWVLGSLGLRVLEEAGLRADQGRSQTGVGAAKVGTDLENLKLRRMMLLSGLDLPETGSHGIYQHILVPSSRKNGNAVFISS